MIRKSVRYTVEDGAVDEVVAAVGEFVDAVRRHELRTTYRAYRLDGGTSFLHLMSFPDGEAEEAHRTADYTQRFVEQLYPRCPSPPEFAEVEEVAATG